MTKTTPKNLEPLGHAHPRSCWDRARDSIKPFTVGTITPERDKELRKLALNRMSAEQPTPETRALLDKISEVTITPQERARLQRLIEKGGGGRPYPVILDNAQEWERFQRHMTEETLRRTQPDARRGRAQLEQNRKNAPIGGKNTAHYTDAEVEQAFAEYKRRTKEKTAWNAAQSLTRPGAKLDRWKGKNAGANCYKRFTRIAKSKYGISPETCFASLEKTLDTPMAGEM